VKSDEKAKTADGTAARSPSRGQEALKGAAGWVRKNPAPLWGSLLLQASCFMPGCEARISPRH